MKKVGAFLKSNIIFIVVLLISISTIFFVPIDKEYLGYFQWDTIACIFMILLIVAGLNNIGFFQKTARILVKKFKNTRAIIMCLIFITYISALINANDMALLTFLPLSYAVLKYTDNLKYCAFTFVMQNIASNLGGMITPIGNPQNLYIYSYYNLSILEFFRIMFLPTLFALILIIAVCMFVKKTPISFDEKNDNKIDIRKAVAYFLMFVFVILVVLRVVNYVVGLVAIVVLMLAFDWRAFLKVDYTIPLTFVCFFIFSGNLARIPAVMNLLTSLLEKSTYLASYVSCQLISNVPTAVLMSKFTTNYAELLVSVNVASLGIIFSSLSGIISLKEYSKVAKKESFRKGRGVWYYILIDTIFNVVGALILVPLSYFTLGLL